MNLVLVRHEGHVAEEDFQRVAVLAREHNSRVRPHVVLDQRSRLRSLLLARRRSLVFATGPIDRFRPVRGRVFQGRPLPKSVEYKALEAAGVPVPRWTLLTETRAPDLSDFGPYVVVKPDRGGRGADVHAYRKSKVRWKPRQVERFSDGGADRIVQEFVYTGPWPASYRVVTLFGEALIAYRVDADHARQPLADRYAFKEASGITIVSNSKGCSIRLHEDEDVIRLAQRAHGAFPDLALLGVDVIREQPGGKLYVLEVNSIGWTWHFSSPDGQRIRRETGDDPYAQRNGLERAARLLADRAVALAR